MLRRMSSPDQQERNGIQQREGPVPMPCLHMTDIYLEDGDYVCYDPRYWALGSCYQLGVGIQRQCAPIMTLEQIGGKTSKVEKPEVCGLGAGGHSARDHGGHRGSGEEATRPVVHHGSMCVLEHVSLKCLTDVWVSLLGKAGLAVECRSCGARVESARTGLS